MPRPLQPRLFRRSAALCSLIAAVLLLILTACSSAVPGSAVVAGGPGAAGSATARVSQTPVSPAPIPAGLERFYGQRLDWGSCADHVTSDDTKYFRSASLQCADLTVPLSYADPDGQTITVAVLRKPATDPNNRIGSVVIDPGGPGASGVDFAGYLGGFGIGADLSKRFDLVGFDPRGVGYSVPSVQCQTNAERDAERARTSRTRTPEEVAAAEAVNEAYAKGCATLTGADQGIDGTTFLANVGTRDVAKDLDVLRAALGDEQLTYIGWSYGTSIGTAYAEQFPGNVRAMILDGAVDPNADPAADIIAQGEGFQQAFDDFAAWCAEQDSCALGKDPSKATAVFQGLVRPLLDAPLQLSDGRVLSFSDAVTGTSQALYAKALWDTLSTALVDLSNGKGEGLMSLADTYDGRSADGTYTNIQDAFVAIQCIDGSREYDQAQADATAEKFAAAAPYRDSGDPPKGIRDPCQFWPAAPTSSPHEPAVAGLPKVLVISTTHDPATPYQAGVNLAEALGASLLTVEGTNHTAYLNAGSECVDDIGTNYLVSLQLPADGTTCS